MKRPRSKHRPNEDPKYIQEMLSVRPNRTARQWIEEALAVNNDHCSDDAITVSNMLYLALETLRNTDSQRVSRLARVQAYGLDTHLSKYK